MIIINFAVPADLALHFELGGTTYLNNTVVVVGEIGEEDGALHCVTDRQNLNINRQGQFYYPDGSVVPISDMRQDFYRNRDSRFIRLNRRNSATSPLGQYRCEIPDSRGVMQNLLINLGIDII